MNVVSGESPGDRLARALAGAAVPEQFRRAFTSTPPIRAPVSCGGPAGTTPRCSCCLRTSTRPPSTRSR